MVVQSQQPIIEAKKDSSTVAACVAQWVLESCLATAGTIRICLSGGSTPRTIYAQLALQPYASSMPWERIHWFWGDERYVSEDDPLSNYRMVKEAMLDHVMVPDINIHRINTGLPTPMQTAAEYECILQNCYGSASLEPQRPLFDITFLGLGTDGHTASLFPGTEVLQERKKWVAMVTGAKPETRITLTFPVLNSSRRIAFLITGADKKEILQKFLKHELALPAVHVKAMESLYVFTDQEAYPEQSKGS